MLGLVLWAREGRGIIWCEDQDDLVYFSAEALDDLPVDPLQIGDFVRFSYSYSLGHRIATSVEVITSNCFGEGLADVLLKQRDAREIPGTALPAGRQILPFRQGPSKRSLRRLGGGGREIVAKRQSRGCF